MNQNLINHLKKIWNDILNFFSDTENPEEPIYDPVHLGGMIVVVIFACGLIFWLFWTLLVFEGGLFSKIIPALKVLFTKKTLQDYGWIGYPYEMGIFSGFIANTIALILTIALLISIWWIFNQKPANLDKSNHDLQNQ